MLASVSQTLRGDCRDDVSLRASDRRADGIVKYLMLKIRRRLQ